MLAPTRISTWPCRYFPRQHKSLIRTPLQRFEFPERGPLAQPHDDVTIRSRAFTTPTLYYCKWRGKQRFCVIAFIVLLTSVASGSCRPDADGLPERRHLGARARQAETKGVRQSCSDKRF